MLAPALLVHLVLAQAGTVVGEIVVVNDASGTAHSTSNLVAGVGSTLCAFAARGLSNQRPDVFDVVVAFTTNPLTGGLISNAATPKGTLVRSTSTGAVLGSPLIVLPPSEYGSPSRLAHCVFMGPVQNAPANPDDDFRAPSFGGGTTPTGLTGIEVLGHEFGHQWLVQSAFDSGAGRSALHRADAREPANGTQMDRSSLATLHYSHLADSESVMFGNFITPLGNDQYRLSGGARKFGPLDQYFMGLRSPAETPPMRVLDDGSGMGLIGTPLRRGETETVTAQRELLVSVDDFIRVQGPRVPAFPAARRCFRVAFVLVTAQGTTATQAQLDLVDAYRRRWESWFTQATDQRANSVTSLEVFAECPEPALSVDAGVPAEDAGVEVDGGTEEVDAGTNPMMTPDAGDPEELGRVDTGKIRPGCGCSSGAEFAACFALAFLSRRRIGPSPRVRRERESDGY
jgi:hypothetical protein